MTDDERTVDVGSAARTRLAWRRTALSTTTIAALMIKVAVRDGFSDGNAVAVALTGFGWIAAMWFAHRRITAMSALTPQDVRRSLPGTALLVVGFAVLGIVLVAA